MIVKDHVRICRITMLGVALMASFALTSCSSPSGNETGDSSTADASQAETARQNPHNVWVFLLAGQSNMAGRGKIESQDTVADERILTIDSAGRLIPAREPLHFYEPKRAGLDCGLSFAKTLVASAPDDVSILLLPTAIGGSSIDQWLGDSVYRHVQLLSNFREKVKLGLQYGEIKAILWHQGESDASPKRIPVYKEKLSRLISTFRSIVSNDSLPVLIGELGAFPKNLENRLKINTIISEYAREDPAVKVISTADLAHKGDSTHFDSKGQRLMGERFAEKYLEYMKGRSAD